MKTVNGQNNQDSIPPRPRKNDGRLNEDDQKIIPGEDEHGHPEEEEVEKDPIEKEDEEEELEHKRREKEIHSNEEINQPHTRKNF